VTPRQLLKKHWGYDDFKGSQQLAIEAILDGRDVLALFPTGGGKSVCYQVPALSLEGLCVVVSPLIALIQDQVLALRNKGIKALSLTGGMSEEDVINLLDNCQYGDYKFLYLSPERLQQNLVRERLAHINVNLLAIDEAHCISQWGNDFRPAYLQCAVLRELKPGVPMIALTATATRVVAAEIIENLGLEGCLVLKDSYLRENIAYSVIRTEDKEYQVKQLTAQTGGSGIVYVRTRKKAESLAVLLNKSGSPAGSFHGGMTRKEKSERLRGWMSSKTPFMVATNAFGMGVDKPDVRTVVHFQLPDSIENYFQEAGRAGRDGKPSQAVLLHNPTDEAQIRRQFLGTLPDVPFLKKLYHYLNNYFQIPYGTGENSTYSFHFNGFCETYKLNTLLAYNGFQALDQHSVIALSQHFMRKTKLRFIASKAQLWTYLDTHPQIAPLIKLLLRTYGGLFDFETKINTLLVARKGAVTEEAVLDVLELLRKDGIIEYTARHGDLEITFLQPREDDRTINRFAPLLRNHQQVRVNHVEKMLEYIHNTQDCRARQLLVYFGESLPGECGQCDVCLRRIPVTEMGIETVQHQVIALLKDRSLTSRAIISELKIAEALVVEALQLLLEAGEVFVGDKNEYSISE
jgi:ATP-dependent DNA helicase RecQ